MTFVLGATWLALNVWVAENLDVLATIATCGIAARVRGSVPAAGDAPVASIPDGPRAH
ncbi:hypothetical protein [Modestobacter sp. URMC 112]